LKLLSNNTARFSERELREIQSAAPLCQSMECPKMKVIGIAPKRKNTIFCRASLLVESNQMEVFTPGVLNALRRRIQPGVRLQ
jgi:hypothetical protein